jgi:hypothetical protein
MKRLLPAFLIFLFASPGFAQKASSAQTLRLAQATYESGRLHEVEGFLRDFKSTVKQEQVAAYKLLCLSYIYLEEPAKADEQMLRILTTDNYFKPSDADPAEFVALWKTFRRDPIYRLGGKLGPNASQPNVISYVPPNSGKSEYLFGIGFQAGVAFELPLPGRFKGFTLAPELNVNLKNFKYSNKATYIEAVTEEKRDFETTGKENQIWISLPVVIQHDVFSKRFEKSKIKPFISAGISIDYLLSSTNTFLRTKENASSIDETKLDLKLERNKINLSGVLSAGTKIQVKGGYAIAEVRYTYGLTKVNDKENVYQFDKVFPTNTYADGIFKMNTLSVTVGYVHNWFNPIKLNK